MREKSYAKITLSLYAYKEGDELRFKNIIVPIDLFDMVYLDKCDEMKITTNKRYLPNDKRNTVYLALELLKEKYQINDNFKVHIVKNIPAQSGLGGGSSNAATVINMFDKMYDLNMSLKDKMEVAKQIDEDTPYCIETLPSAVEGYGQIVNPIAYNVEMYYLLVKPGFGVSTKSFLRKFKNTDTRYEDSMEKMSEACALGDYEKILDARYNSFQNTVIEKYEGMSKVIDKLESLGLDGVGMTGSGSCVYGLSQDKETVMNIFEKIVFDYPFVKYGKVKP